METYDCSCEDRELVTSCPVRTVCSLLTGGELLAANMGGLTAETHKFITILMFTCGKGGPGDPSLLASSPAEPEE